MLFLGTIFPIRVIFYYLFILQYNIYLIDLQIKCSEFRNMWSLKSLIHF